MIGKEALLKAERIGLTGRLNGIKGYVEKLINQSQDTIALEFGKYLLDYSKFSCSQFRQDLFVSFFLMEKESGTFVEFGGADGVTHSNTFSLEQNYSWQGIILEPTITAFKELCSNRPNALLVRAAISVGDECHMEIILNNQTSSLVGFHDKDGHSARRISALEKGSVETVPMVDLSLLLKAHFNSRELDYISIDVEGAELDVIKKYDFSIRPALFTIEHNNRNDDLLEISTIMKSNDYVRVFENYHFFTGPEAWFVRDDIYTQRLSNVVS